VHVQWVRRLLDRFSFFEEAEFRTLPRAFAATHLHPSPLSKSFLLGARERDTDLSETPATMTTLMAKDSFAFWKIFPLDIRELRILPCSSSPSGVIFWTHMRRTPLLLYRQAQYGYQRIGYIPYRLFHLRCSRGTVG